MDYSKILIIKPSSLGDIVHALPAAAALRQLYPAAALTWLVKPEWSEILEGNLDIDEIVILPAWPRRLFRTVRLLRAKRFDLVVDRNLAVVASLGAEIGNPQFSIPFFPSDQLAVETWLREAGVQPGDQLVAMAPQDRRGVRSWPLERFVAAAGALSRADGVRIVLIGASTSRKKSAQFRAAVGDKLVDLHGKTRVGHLGPLLRRVNLLIANDSAPIHIAAA